jgi:hypothetical protein
METKTTIIDLPDEFGAVHAAIGPLEAVVRGSYFILFIYFFITQPCS